MMAKRRSIIPLERIEQNIHFVRGHKVMLDADLAGLYGVQTKVLNQAVKRNLDRFPPDFMFRLTWTETQASRSQIVTLNKRAATDRRRGQNPKYTPFAFTEHGAIMAANVLNSKRAVKASIYVVRAFVKLRQILATNAELARRLDQLENRIGRHDEQFNAVIHAIRELMEPPPDPPRKRIGFLTEAEGRHRKGR